MFSKCLLSAALVTAGLLATAADAHAFGRCKSGGKKGSSCGASVSSGYVASSGGCQAGCGTTGFVASAYAPSFAPACSPCQIDPAFSTAPQFRTIPQALPSAAPPSALPGAGPQLLPDVTKALPAPETLPTAPAAPGDFQPAYANDPATGKPRHIGWVRGTQFVPLKP